MIGSINFEDSAAVGHGKEHKVRAYKGLWIGVNLFIYSKIILSLQLNIFNLIFYHLDL